MDEEEEADPRPYVDHTYHDFSRYIDLGGRVPKHKKSDNNFPAKLHMMLSDPDNSHIITWMPHGRAWKILDKELLMSTLAPAYFGQTKFQSFTRQLNGWGFKRLHRPGSDLGCYYHQCFLRGLPKLTPLMRRLTANQGPKRPHAEGEPNFILISRTYPLPPASISSAQDSSTAALSNIALPDQSSPAECGDAQNHTSYLHQTMDTSGQGDAEKYPIIPPAHGTSLACSAVASVPSTTPLVPSHGTQQNPHMPSALDPLKSLSVCRREDQALSMSSQNDAKYPMIPLAQSTSLASSVAASASSTTSHVPPHGTGQNPPMPSALDALNNSSTSTAEVHAIAVSGQSDAKYSMIPLARGTSIACSASASVSSTTPHVPPHGTGQKSPMPSVQDPLNSQSMAGPGRINEKYPMIHPPAQDASLTSSAAAPASLTTPHVLPHGTGQNPQMSSALDALHFLSACTGGDRAMAQPRREDVKYPIMPPAQDTSLACSATASASSTTPCIPADGVGRSPPIPSAVEPSNILSTSTAEETAQMNPSPFYEMVNTAVHHYRTYEREQHPTTPATQESSASLLAGASRASSQVNSPSVNQMLASTTNDQNASMASSRNLPPSATLTAPMVASRCMNDQQHAYQSHSVFSGQNELPSSSHPSKFSSTSTSTIPDDGPLYSGNEHYGVQDQQPGVSAHLQESKAPSLEPQERGERIPNTSSVAGQFGNFNDDMNAFMDNFPF